MATKTIKGDELKALRGLINIAYNQLQSNKMPSDMVGYAILDYRVTEIKVKISDKVNGVGYSGEKV